VPAPILDDRLWLLIEPLLPQHPRRRRSPGRKRIDDRRCLTGILYVLKTGIPWEYLPTEMGCGSGVTCWRRLREWQAAGVWEKLHRLLLSKLQAAERLDWSRAAVDSSTIRAVGAGEKKRAKSSGSKPSRKQAPHPRRWKRDPFVRLLDPRQRP
jgi:transposase